MEILYGKKKKVIERHEFNVNAGGKLHLKTDFKKVVIVFVDGKFSSVEGIPNDLNENDRNNWWVLGAISEEIKKIEGDKTR